MVCYYPLAAYRLTDSKGNVKINVLGSVFDYDNFKLLTPYYSKGVLHEPLVLRCGQCDGCRLENSRTWAVRCIHEASLWPENAFVTLTYDNVHLPEDNGLHKDHLQKFFKRLRKSLGGHRIRYFACGEYGSLENRPHYHALIFNYWPTDAQLYNIRRGSKLFTSQLLAKVWPFGFHTIGECTFESAAYVARYVLKKINGKWKDFYYDGLQPEFVVMSRRPGIAYDWIKKFHGDVYPNDFIIVRDQFKCRPPKYYDMIYDRDLNGDLEYIKNKRADCCASLSFADIKRKEKFTDEILKTKLKRNFEDNNIL